IHSEKSSRRRWQGGLFTGHDIRCIGHQAIGGQSEEVERYSRILIADLRQLAFADPEQMNIGPCAGRLGSLVVQGKQANLSEQIAGVQGMINLLKMNIAGYDHVDAVGMIAFVEKNLASF